MNNIEYTKKTIVHNINPKILGYEEWYVTWLAKLITGIDIENLQNTNVVNDEVLWMSFGESRPDGGWFSWGESVKKYKIALSATVALLNV